MCFVFLSLLSSMSTITNEEMQGLLCQLTPQNHGLPYSSAVQSRPIVSESELVVVLFFWVEQCYQF